MRYQQRHLKIIIILLSAIVALQWLFILKLSGRKKPAVQIAHVKGRIAIVIDDWGYNMNNAGLIGNIKSPLTASVLPNLPFSRSIADGLREKGFQVILHLPLESREGYRLEKNTILTSMSEQSIKQILLRDFYSLGPIKGVSNHMGSKATVDARIMGIIFAELKKRGLYFLDSLVSSGSVCSDEAKKLNLCYVRRDVFLDNVEEPQYIRKQIYKLKNLAELHGKAIGIGHDRKVTLEVLKDMIPQLEKEGYRFVFVSDLTQK